MSPPTSIRASPTVSPICQGGPSRYSSASKPFGQPEVSLAARGEADVAADAGNAERLHLVVVEVEADDVPLAPVEEERVGVDGSLAALVANDRPVLELQRPALRDRALELCEPPGQLGRVAGVVQLDRASRLRRRLLEARPAEREVLQRETQRLGVRELALEQVEAGLKRRELLVGQLERRQEVALRAQPVELFARELVALRVERNAQRQQLGAVGVEASGERLVRHLLVALDVLLDVPGGQRATLGHQEGDERELADELVGVVRHAPGLFFPMRVSCHRRKHKRRVCNSGREALECTRVKSPKED